MARPGLFPDRGKQPPEPWMKGAQPLGRVIGETLAIFLPERADR
jgi:hypothetical protein